MSTDLLHGMLLIRRVEERLSVETKAGTLPGGVQSFAVIGVSYAHQPDLQSAKDWHSS